jgi:hypothetical protein
MNKTRDIALLAAGAALAPRRTEHVYQTNHTHENRAPTDESVALLREMEAAAEAEVIKAIHVQNNTFNCVLHPMYSGMDDENILRAVFDINGKRMTAEARVISGGGAKGKLQLLQSLHAAMAEKIAVEIMRQSLDGVQLPD